MDFAADIGLDQAQGSDVDTIDLDLSQLASAIESPAELVSALNRIPGVRMVTLLPGGVTITRSHAVPWERILPEVRHVLRGLLDLAAAE